MVINSVIHLLSQSCHQYVIVLINSMIPTELCGMQGLSVKTIAT